MRTHGRVTAVMVVLALAVSTLSSFAGPGAVRAAVGGPVILGGDDMTDHGSRSGTNLNGWLYLERAIENVLPQVARAGNDGSIAALGSSDSTGTSGGDAGAAIHWAANDAGSGVPVTYYEGEAAIRDFFLALGSGAAKPAIIWIAGTGAGNDLSGDEPAALIDNATGLAGFVNTGGGLISHGTEYGWLTALLPTVTTVNGGSSDDLYLTPEGLAAFPGVTNSDINAGPWHNHFEGNLGGLQVLARSHDVQNRQTQEDAAVIIGGGSVVLPGADPGPIQIPYISITKSASAVSASAGASVTYTYAVTNTSIDALLYGISVSDDKCAAVAFTGGDADHDGNLQIGETWTYNCTTTLASTTTNVATATGKWRTQTVTATASATVTVGVSEVLAATDRPEITLPPTTTAAVAGSDTAGPGIGLILLILGGLGLMVGLFSPARVRHRR